MIRLRMIHSKSQNLDHISNRNERFVIIEDKEYYARIVLQLIARQPILMLFNLTFATYLLSPTWPRKCSRVLRITKAKVTSPICYYYHRYQASIDGKKKKIFKIINETIYFYSTIVQL